MAASNVCSKMRAAAIRPILNRLEAVRLGAVTPYVNGAADAGPESTPYKAAPFLQMGPCNWLISVADASFGRSDRFPNFGLASLDLQQAKSQGEQGEGDVPAENPRNDVPPVPPEEREANPDVPPSPDETSAKANQADYSSPGEHPSQGKDDRMKPDMDNANPAVTQQAAGAEVGKVTFLDADAASEMRQYISHSHADLRVEGQGHQEQAQDASNVFTAPVETLLETPLNASSTGDDDNSTGPASHKDDPPGVDVDPNQVPPADDQKGTDKGADQ
jgi:hypothetical protein